MFSVRRPSKPHPLSLLVWASPLRKSLFVRSLDTEFTSELVQRAHVSQLARGRLDREGIRNDCHKPLRKSVGFSLRLNITSWIGAPGENTEEVLGLSSLCSQFLLCFILCADSPVYSPRTASHLAQPDLGSLQPRAFLSFLVDSMKEETSGTCAPLAIGSGEARCAPTARR